MCGVLKCRLSLNLAFTNFCITSSSFKVVVETSTLYTYMIYIIDDNTTYCVHFAENYLPVAHAGIIRVTWSILRLLALLLL